MNEIERYCFDTQGYLVIEDVLTADELRKLKAGLPRNTDGSFRKNNVDLIGNPISYAEPTFRSLINHPRIVPYLKAIFCNGSDPWDQTILLDHDYGMIFKRGDKGPPFHNGGTPHVPWLSYTARDGKIFCALSCVVWALTDVNAGDGGFWCLPGSHKASFPLPEKIRCYQHVPACAVQPAMKAGSALLFTEALTHGTRDWRADHERIALFYKYSPGYMARMKTRPASVLEKLSDEQRRFVLNPRDLIEVSPNLSPAE